MRTVLTALAEFDSKMRTPKTMKYYATQNYYLNSYFSLLTVKSNKNKCHYLLLINKIINIIKIIL